MKPTASVLFVLLSFCTYFSAYGQSYQTHLDELNAYFETFDGGYYGPLSVSGGSLTCYIESYGDHGSYSMIPIAAMGEVREMEPNQKVGIICENESNCVTGVNGSMYMQMSFSTNQDFDTQWLKNKLQKLTTSLQEAYGYSTELKNAEEAAETDNHSYYTSLAENTTSDEEESVSAVSTSGHSSSEKKVALVFGNSHYYGSADLGSNPINDANDMAGTLRQLGFDVILKTDASLNTMTSAIREFGRQNRDADVALFYFAGHGMQIDRTNYLLPIGAQISEPQDIGFETVSVATVQNIMESSNSERLNLIVLDACRNNPFRTWERGGTSGLASMTPPSGTLIAFATSPGSVASNGAARNGLYTGELIKQLQIPQRIEDVFINTRIEVERKSDGQQSPWELARLRGKYFLVE